MYSLAFSFKSMHLQLVINIKIYIVFNWNLGDYFYIISYLTLSMDLGSINWSILFYSNFNINENLNTFYYHIDYAIKNYILKNRRHKLCIPIWFSNELKTLIKVKIGAFQF